MKTALPVNPFQQSALSKRRFEIIERANAATKSQSPQASVREDRETTPPPPVKQFKRPAERKKESCPEGPSFISEGLQLIKTDQDVDDLIAQLHNRKAPRCFLIETVYSQSHAIILQVVTKEKKFKDPAPNKCQQGGDLRCPHCFFQAAEKYLREIGTPKKRWEIKLLEDTELERKAHQQKQKARLAMFVAAQKQKKNEQTTKPITIELPDTPCSSAKKPKHTGSRAIERSISGTDTPKSLQDELAEKKLTLQKNLSRRFDRRLQGNRTPLPRVQMSREIKKEVRQLQKGAAQMKRELKNYEDGALGDVRRSNTL